VQDAQRLQIVPSYRLVLRVNNEGALAHHFCGDARQERMDSADVKWCVGGPVLRSARQTLGKLRDRDAS
jgi:hypothetical protein